MILSIDDQVLTDSRNLSETELELSESFSNTNYENSSFVSHIVYTLLSESFDFSSFILNYINNLASNLQNNCIESSFEFKVFTILLGLLFTILIAIIICWRFFWERIDHFYRKQEYYIKTYKPVAPKKTGPFDLTKLKKN